MRTSETSAAIRSELKAAGYNQKRVSVRKRSTGSVNVEILDPTANVEEIENIAKKYESYDRDERTGEILCGGNTFVFVDVSEAVKEAWAAPYMEAAENALQEAEGLEGGGTGVRVSIPNVEGFVIFKNGYKTFALHYFSEGHCGSRIADRCYGAKGVARHIGEKLNEINHQPINA
jgi:hypothetical protein